MTIQRNPAQVVPTLLNRLSVAKTDAGAGDGGQNLSKLGSSFENLENEIRKIEELCPKVKKLDEIVMAKFRDLEQQLDSDVFENPNQVDKIRHTLLEITKMVQAISTVTIPEIDSGTSEDSKPQKSDGSEYQNRSEVWEDHSVEEKIQEDTAMALTDLQVSFDVLDPQLKICLLCFSIFPENSVIKKKPLIYWWIGEGLITQMDEKTADEIGDGIFEKLVKKGMIEPFYKKQCPRVNSYKVHPWIRRMLIFVAKKAEFFEFDSKGIPKTTTNFLNSHRACLISGNGKGKSKNTLSSSANGSVAGATTGGLNPDNGTSVHQPDPSAKGTKSNSPKQVELRTIFNGNKQILDFKADEFSKMKKLVVLQLGRWQSSSEHHIELENSDCLKNFGALKHLKYLSLQGISNIRELPPSIGKLNYLKILDLQACHNLEKLPSEIKSLKNLTHFDVSECYLLDHIPKEIKDLPALQVLKGFLMGDSTKNRCNLGDLAASKKLRKLSINIGSKADTAENELATLKNFEALRILTLTWGGLSLPSIQNPKLTRTITIILNSISLPSNLEKLDLRCFPRETEPVWLKPSTLVNLKRLYIRGGKIKGLIHEDDYNWNVKILRLKFLAKFDMIWSDLQTQFPELDYLEKVDCVKLEHFPCNEEGVWLKEKA